MPAEDPVVSGLACAVLDGTDIDWESAGRCASAETQPLIEEFCAAIREGRPPAVDGECGKSVSQILEQVYSQAR